MRTILRKLWTGITHPRLLWVRLRGAARYLVFGPPPQAPPPLPAPVPEPRLRVTGLTGAFGVNATGYLRAETGVGESIRADIRFLRRSGVPFVVNDLIRDGASVNLEQIDGAVVSPGQPYAINLVQVNADHAQVFANLAGSDYFRGRYTIAAWCWELSRFPDFWRDAFRFYDEIWCHTAFALDAISRASPIPVVRMPFAVPERLEVAPGHDRAHFRLPADAFVFLFVFDFASITERKNPLAAVEAFKRAFGGDEDAMLVIKTSHPERDPQGMERLAAAASHPRIRVFEGVWPRPQVNALVAACDCYVSLHRAEGFGVTLAEAMVAGKPVIATAYSGNTDFMTLSNSFPVKYRVVEIERDYGPYRKGCVWAEPDLDHAAALMRTVYENPDLAAEAARTGQRDIVANFGPDAVGRMARERLLAIASFHHLAVPESLRL